MSPDLPGHGDATALAGLDLWETASHLAGAIGPTLDGPAVWLGYSMGARVALHVALSHPELVSGLILIGGTAGIDDTTTGTEHGEADEQDQNSQNDEAGQSDEADQNDEADQSGEAARAERRASDAALAERLELIGVEAFLEEWLALPLFDGLPDWARFVQERRRNTAAGLAGSLRHAGTGSMDPLWDRLDQIRVPTMCIAGERDAKFAALAERMSVALLHGTAVTIAGAGHAAHLEDAGAVAELVVTFCGQVAPQHATRRNDAPGIRWYETSSTRRPPAGSANG